jgi:hypothetical protein
LQALQYRKASRGGPYDPSDDLAAGLGVRPATLPLSLHRLKTWRDT